MTFDFFNSFDPQVLKAILPRIVTDFDYDDLFRFVPTLAIPPARFFRDQLSFNPEKFSEYLLASIEKAHSVVVRTLLGHSLMQKMSSADVVAAFDQAIRYGDVAAVRSLIENPAITVAKVDEAFARCCESVLVPLIEFLKDHTKLTWVGFREGFLRSCKAGQTTIIELLFYHRYLSPSILGDGYVQICTKGHVPLVSRFLSDERLSQNRKEIGFIKACKHNRADILAHLDPVSNGVFIQGLQNAGREGCFDVIKKLKNCPATLLAIGNVFYYACLNGYQEIVALLENDLRLTPEHLNDGFHRACQEGRTEIARLLLLKPELTIRTLSFLFYCRPEIKTLLRELPLQTQFLVHMEYARACAMTAFNSLTSRFSY